MIVHELSSLGRGLRSPSALVGKFSNHMDFGNGNKRHYRVVKFCSASSYHDPDIR